MRLTISSMGSSSIRQVANFDGGQNLADQIGGGRFSTRSKRMRYVSSSTCSTSSPSREKLATPRLWSRSFKTNLICLVRRRRCFEVAKLAVVEHAAVVDDHDASAQLLDVVEIVRGQQNGGVEFAVDGAEKVADVILGHHVEADGRLVEK